MREVKHLIADSYEIRVTDAPEPKNPIDRPAWKNSAIKVGNMDFIAKNIGKEIGIGTYNVKPGFVYEVKDACNCGVSHFVPESDCKYSCRGTDEKVAILSLK